MYVSYHVRFLSKNVGVEALWGHPLDRQESLGLCSVVAFAVNVSREPEISNFNSQIFS